jgi:hypothetical protein
MNHEEIAKHIADVVEASPMPIPPESPFPTLRMSGFFPEDVYIKMRADLPEPEMYREIKHRDALRADGTSTRLLLELKDIAYKEGTAKDEQFWGLINQALCSDSVRRAVLTRFGVGLASQAHPCPALVRDYPGYCILPHPDTGSKIITMQVYLCGSEHQNPQMGTTFHWDDSRRTHCPYRPNSGYGFRVSKNSLHSAGPVPEGVIRDSLLLIYYRDPDQAYCGPRTK